MGSSFGIGAVMVMNTIILVVSLIAYFCCLKRFKLFKRAKENSLRSLRKHVQVDEFDGKLQSYYRKGPVLCLMKVFWFVLGDEERYLSFGKRFGYEVAQHLFLLHQLLLGLGFMSFMATFVILPIHLSGTLPERKIHDSYGTWTMKKDDYPLLRTTVSMVIDDPYKLYVHVGMSCVFIFTLLVIMFRFAFSRVVQDYPFTGKKQVSDYSIQISGLPPKLIDENLLKQAANVEPVYDGKVSSTRIALNTSERVRMQTQLEKIIRRLSHYEKVFAKSKKRPKACFCCRRKDAIEILEQRKLKLIEKVRQWDEKNSSQKGSGYGFLIFDSIQSKEEAIKSGEKGKVQFNIELTGKGKPSDLSKISFTNVTHAPESNDIIWGNLKHSVESRTFKRGLTTIVFVLFLILFTSPLALLSGAQSAIDYIPAEVHGILDFIRTASGWVGELFFQYLPTLLLLILSSSLPYVIPMFTKFESYQTYTEAMIQSTWRLFLYLMITTLILPTLAATSFDGIIKYITFDNFQDMFQKLFVTGSGVFFINYTLQYAYWGTIIDLLRIRDIAVYLWKSFWAVDQSEKEEAAQIGEFQYEVEIGFLMSFIAIPITYSLFCPILLPILFIYCIIKYFIDRHNIINVCDKNPNSTHRILPSKRMYRWKMLLLMNLVFVIISSFVIFQLLFFMKGGEKLYPHVSIMVLNLLFIFSLIIFFNVTFTIRGYKRHSLILQEDESEVPFIKDGDKTEIHPLEAQASDDEFVGCYVSPFQPLSFDFKEKSIPKPIDPEVSYHSDESSINEQGIDGL